MRRRYVGIQRYSSTRQALIFIFRLSKVIYVVGSKLSDAGKQYSKASSNALKRLDSVEKKIEGIVHRVEDVVSVARGPDANSDDVTQLLKSKNELVQIMGDLERLQFKGVFKKKYFCL